MKQSAFGAWLRAGLFTLFVVTAGALSLAANITFGLQMNPLVAIGLGLTDCLKLTLPAVAVVAGTTLKGRIAYRIAVVLSIVSALAFLLETQGNRLMEINQNNQIVRNASAQIEASRQELAAIDEVLDSKTLKTMADEVAQAAEREGGRGFCGPKCEKLKAEQIELMARLGKAHRREALEAELAAASQTITTTPEKVMGPAKTLATLTGYDEQTIGMITVLAISLLLLAAIELAAMFSDTAMASIRGAMAISNKGRKVEPKVAAPSAARTTKQAAFEAVLAAYQTADELPSNRQLAERLNIPRSTFADWMKEWKAEGLLTQKPVKLRVIS